MLNILRCTVGRLVLFVCLLAVSIVGCVVIILLGDQIDWVVRKLNHVHEHYNEIMEEEVV